ncbi:MAG: hypothetical protein A2Y94_08115 [Caldithrix sp. RBG_13_44_9]|nr:MAG: hypothetical protein A2Y94_08115 [Caldithrix sp. RBG_13_44_9]
MRSIFLYLTLMILIIILLKVAQAADLSIPPPDSRFKTDILLIVAHPDDETAIGSYLAKAIYDLHKDIAIIYTTRGSGGGNSQGNEQSLALGQIRETEGRRAAAKFGIYNVWFLDGEDTPGQDVFHSLQNWGHGKILEQVIRLVRLTRPEVIISWLPHYVAGENHGDHQAAGVIATEAFDLSGNPTIFPAQVTLPRERLDINNFSEGLIPWQPKKIYYFSDASHQILAAGPVFDISEISPSKKVPYYRLAADLHLEHLTQGDVSENARQALESGDFTAFRQWLSNFKLIFGKSLVECTATADVFAEINSQPLSFHPVPGYEPEPLTGTGLRLGGAFAYYRDFHRAHQLEHLTDIGPPEMEVATGSYVHVPLLLHNGGADSVTILLNSILPDGWQEVTGSATYRLGPNQTWPVQTFYFAPDRPQLEFKELVWEASIAGKMIGRVMVRTIIREWTLPQ